MKNGESSEIPSNPGRNDPPRDDVYAGPPHLTLASLQGHAKQKDVAKPEEISLHDAERPLAPTPTCTLLTDFDRGRFRYLLTWSDPKNAKPWEWVALCDHEPKSSKDYLAWEWCYADRHENGSFSTNCCFDWSRTYWVAYFNRDNQILCKESFMCHPHWMADIAADIQGKKLREVVLPASHDSGTYGITSHSAFSPDLPEDLRSEIARGLIPEWAKTQVMNVAQQLDAGCRVFDLRVAKREDGEFWIYHGMYSVKLTEVLNAVKRFDDSNPREIILLMFSNFLKMEHDDHVKFLGLLKNTFGPALAQNSLGVDAKVQDFWSAGTPILIVSEYEDLVSPVLWKKSSTVETPYSEKDFNSADSVIAWLRENVIAKEWDKFWVLPLILTEDFWTVLEWTLFGGMARWTYDTAVSKFTRFYQGQSRKMNIIAVDYLNFYPLVKWAIQKNREQAPMTQKASG